MKTKTPREIRKDMEETRHEIDHTVHLIQERMDPRDVRKLAEAGLSRARQATEDEAERQLRKVSRSIDSASTSLAQKVRKYPIATALIGIGLGILLTRQDQRRTLKGK